MRGHFIRWLMVVPIAVLCASQAPAAGNYPSHRVHIIVPFPAGGIADLSGRLIAEGLRTKLNQPVIENKPGAEGVLGFREMMKAEAAQIAHRINNRLNHAAS
jgi:tripartite-type tricarboxylate transporter receptor subunit TctC